MNRTEAIEHFKSHHFNSLLAQALEKIYIYYNANKQTLMNDFYAALRSAFDAFQAGLDNGGCGLSYINILQVLSSFACDKKGEHIIQVYGKDNIKPACSISYDSSWIFQEFILLYNAMIKESRKYVGKIHLMDLRQLLLENLYMTNGFLEPVIYGACKKIESDGGFSLLVNKDKCVVFQEVICMSWSPSSRYFPIYIFDTTIKTEDIINSVYDNKNDISYASYNETNLSFLPYDNQYIILTNFKSCTMKSMCLRCGNMVYSSFIVCDMKNSYFSNSCITASEFIDCDLRGSKFDGVTGYKNIKNRPDSIPLDFSGSNLENVSFKNAILTGANFLNTTITNADFSGANLDNAVFLKEMRNSQQFSDNQKQRIQWI